MIRAGPRRRALGEAEKEPQVEIGGWARKHGTGCCVVAVRGRAIRPLGVLSHSCSLSPLVTCALAQLGPALHRLVFPRTLGPSSLLRFWDTFSCSPHGVFSAWAARVWTSLHWIYMASAFANLSPPVKTSDSHTLPYLPKNS